jgi:hypothetical protein
MPDIDAVNELPGSTDVSGSKVTQLTPKTPAEKISYQARDQTQGHLVYFEAPFEKDPAEKGTEVIGFRVPIWLARMLDDVTEAARGRKMCANRHRMLQWMVYQGIIEVSKVLKDPEISDMAAILEEQVERKRRRRLFENFDRTISENKRDIDAFLRRDPPFVYAAEREMQGMLSRIKAIEDPEWRAEWLRSVEPIRERVAAMVAAVRAANGSGLQTPDGEGGGSGGHTAGSEQNSSPEKAADAPGAPQSDDPGQPKGEGTK